MPFLENGLELRLTRPNLAETLLTYGTQLTSVSVKSAHTAPSRSRDKLTKSFPPSRTAVTAVTAGAPWHFERPILRDDGRILGLGHLVPYTHYLPWPGDQPGRPSWPWKCAHVRSAAIPRGRVRVLRGGIGGQLNCGFCVLSVPAAVGRRFMSILTR